MAKNLKGIKFDEKGLVPTIIQDFSSKEVLMMAYMNKKALDMTLETGLTHFWSRTRQQLWKKGETSGNIQKVQEVYFDCDEDTLLIKVLQKGGACHTGYKSCFYNKVDNNGINLIETSEKIFDPNKAYSKSLVLQEVYNVILDRKENPKEGSYTNYLFEKGLDKILKKVGEESAEVIIAAKNRAEDEVVYEVADLIYHLLVTLVDQGINLDEIYLELEKRR
ncbi:MAG TPA: bifunctional phosphoribosyl-AMP cyclohydrolase/phosphoribosyl-ATP diphosphatase HisIE [Clostridia bacterium]|nr:bifunctional phosphoribosyl-AMP cyclohydrolase/phosphoribosyl-ATP diphosphatase HisIE [Clostridia bacterium]